ncbi:alpha/beta fold hydrolase [Ochrobactrum sp. GPK 3]|uniref:alpha/beta hydrolase family protein n=1 Tax=Brucella sp. 22210 TaxID=3453892 RepID=UPI0031384DA1
MVADLRYLIFSTQPLAISEFYNTEVDVSDLTPGTIIRSELLKTDNKALSWRVLYVSQRWNGEHVPASGLVATPRLNNENHPNPVVVWAHGTTGAARGCAPSLAENPIRDFTPRGSGEAKNLPIGIGIPFLNDWLDKGYAVVAPDYAGLGSDAVHHYLVGEDEARDIYNLVRAAQSLPQAKISKRIALFGQSQGGHAVLFAGEIAKDYAPDLQIQSIVALAPASTLVMSPYETDAFFAAKTPIPYLIGQSYIDAYKIEDDLFSEQGHKWLDAARKMCVVELYLKIANSSKAGLAEPVMLSKAWVDALSRNNAGLHKSVAPVLILHGLKDNVVPPKATISYHSRALQAGTDLTVRWIEDAGHNDLFNLTKQQTIEWIDAGFKKNNISP